MSTIKKTKINSLYIHIPFCDSICPYCDFTKFISKDIFKFNYTYQICRDLKNLYKSGYRFKTIYIGGGTPTSLSLKDLRKILKLTKLLLAKKNYEFTIEANPESLDEEKLRLFKSSGVNRISIGIQTFNPKLLKTINRDYGINYFDLIKLVKKYITNINVDLIYGLPGETKEEALIREFQEELQIELDQVYYLDHSVDRQNGKEIELTCFACTSQQRPIASLAHSELVWTTPDHIYDHDFFEADRGLVQTLEKEWLWLKKQMKPKS